LAEKKFVIGEVSNYEGEPLFDLKKQRRIEDILEISNMAGDKVALIKYHATWIYNKRLFLSELLEGMEDEKAQLINEIRHQDLKLRAICGPFGGYRNVLEIDDIHFEDDFLTPEIKK